MRKKDICSFNCFNKEKVDIIKKSILNDDSISNVADILKIICDPTRMKILLSLEKGEICVCDIAHVLGMSLSAVSHQLRLLRNIGLVRYRSEGKMAFYSLKDKKIIGFIKKISQYISK
ncbi:MAG: winged helix-turn-helix transcriptional regulator [Candidatus Aureabacteria bacterium]|nr:winged helix-turn-helix transcriptional regulator [Candidatus Auribacterota bacterium]